MATIAFEDLTPGTVIDLGEVKVDREEMLAFSQRFDPQPFHLDEESARRSVLGGLCASGWFTSCLWMRAYADTVLADSTSQGSPGGREMSWLAPVFPGDLLRMRIEIIGARHSRSRPGLGLVEIVGSAHRSDDCVLRMTFTGMFSTRGYRRLVLASASPARLGVLRSAGIDPVVRVSGVDEDAVAAGLPDAKPVKIVTALARAKADAVATGIATEHPDAVVIGCDSMLHIGGELVGKPGCTDVAFEHWQAIAGGTGELLTGHAVVRLDQGVRTAAASGVQSTVIRFSTPSTEEIAAYVGTGEPLQVAGGFTLDGRGGWFVDGIDGDPSSVIGISLPLTRRLLAEIGVPVVSLWS